MGPEFSVFVGIALIILAAGYVKNNMKGTKPGQDVSGDLAELRRRVERLEQRGNQ